MVSTESNTRTRDVNLYVVRHGKTMFNTVQRVQGWADTPLTPLGVEVVEHLGHGLKDTDFVAVYSSDLGRARETARIILKIKGDTQPIIEMVEFREVCFGSFEGDLDLNMFLSVVKKLGYKDRLELEKALSTGKLSLGELVDTFNVLDESGIGEGYTTLKMRMIAGLKEIAKKVQQQGGGNVLLVTHGMALVAMINELLDEPYIGRIENASVTKIRYTVEGDFIVESIDDTSYIEKGKQR